jgi:hypothetical protein
MWINLNSMKNVVGIIVLILASSIIFGISGCSKESKDLSKFLEENRALREREYSLKAN